MTTCFYLHGWASNPQSSKAQFFKQHGEQQNFPITIPDLNQDDFFHLTLTRQVQQVQMLLPDSPTIIIGSSLGGLTALWLAEKQPQIQKLVLLAPALNFWQNTFNLFGEAKLAQWRQQGEILLYHYGEERELPISYAFMEDMRHYEDAQLQRPLPTLILHGRYDAIVPIQNSRDFAATRPWVQLIELESDHSLNDVHAQLWQATAEFCQLS
jgi:hypothetical protein